MTLRIVVVLVALLAAIGAKKPTDDTGNPAYSSTAVALTADNSGKPAKPAGFIHPGVLVNRAQLDELKKRVAAGIEPQKSAVEKLKTGPLGALDYTPHPRGTVECGSYSKPDLGCRNEQADSEAAYAQALLWSITGNSAYAENAIRIMNAGPARSQVATPTRKCGEGARQLTYT
jgi:hypothetical protein